jgi:hypothetical protein
VAKRDDGHIVPLLQATIPSHEDLMIGSPVQVPRREGLWLALRRQVTVQVEICRRQGREAMCKYCYMSELGALHEWSPTGTESALSKQGCPDMVGESCMSGSRDGELAMKTVRDVPIGYQTKGCAFAAFSWAHVCSQSAIAAVGLDCFGNGA